MPDPADHHDVTHRGNRRTGRRKLPDQVKIIAGINKGRKPRRRSKSQGSPLTIPDRET